MNNMTGKFGFFRRMLYKYFVAEKGGDTPDDVKNRDVFVFEMLALLWVLFLTYYLFMHGNVEGRLVTLEAVANFLVEVIVSFVFVSPVYIFFKFVVGPSIAASLVMSDVRKAKEQYNRSLYKKKKKEKKIRGGNRNSSANVTIVRKKPAMSIASVGKMNLLKQYKGRRRRTSVDGGVGGKYSNGREERANSLEMEMVEMQPGEFREKGDAEELKDALVGLKVDIESIKNGSTVATTNPIARTSQSKISAAAYDEDEDEDGENLVEDEIGIGTNEKWEEYMDEETGHVYYISNLTQRTTWTNHNERETGIGAEEVDDLWEELFDEASGHNYYVNRKDRTVTWTDRREGGLT